MPTHPLTHHEILALVEPFARRGRHPDLAASDRLARRLVFKPIDHAGDADRSSGLREVLELESPRPGLCRLTRVLRPADGPEARLETEGPDPGDLLARIDTVTLQRAFRSGEGFVIAESHRLEPAPGAPDGATALRMTLTRAAAQVAGLALTLTMPTVRGYPAEIALSAPVGERYDLPEDLLAVLGWRWRRLEKRRDAWHSSLSLRGAEPDRSRRAEALLEQAVAHLARTLAEPPGRFHERLSRARWRVAFRRAIPLLASIVLIAGAAALSLVDIAPDSWLQMAILHAPPLLLVGLFCLRETPRIEIPPLPRRSTAPAWREARPAPPAAPIAPGVPAAPAPDPPSA